MRRVCSTMFVLFLTASPAAAQRRPDISAYDTAGAFADAGAATLLNAARALRARSDSTIRSYTAVIRSRSAARMRLPLKDRTLIREETASRVRWSRDADIVVQRLAGRQQSPQGIDAGRSGGIGVSRLFDPASDRMYFAVGAFSTVSRAPDSPGGDDYWIEHPLAADAERHYHYESGDTLTLTLQDGTTLRAIELRVTPRRDDPHTVRGLLWIDPATGAVAQAAFRLARAVDFLHDMSVEDPEDQPGMALVPGFLKPMEFDVSLMTVEYSLWDLQHWLPRTTRFDGIIRAGAFQFPGTFEVSYDIEDVETDADGRAAQEAATARRTAAEWAGTGDYRRTERKRGGRNYITLSPADSVLLRSDLLPPPVWADAPAFATAAEIEEMAERLGRLVVPARRTVDTHFGWGFGEPEMLRYNRVEALSIGARATASLPVGAAGLTARLGVADLHPNAELTLRRATVSRTLQLRVYHELATADESRRALGFGNTLSSLLFGRDEGEYYRATGAGFTWSPPTDARRAWDITAYVEQQDDVRRHTHVALPRLWQDSVFRANITADEATQYGALLHLRPWWGTDPRGVQFGVDVMLQAETGDFRFGRGRITARGAAPLFAGARIGVEAGVGTTVTCDDDPLRADCAVPVQRHFYLGGASTLRGYEPGVVSGTSMARARLELARTLPFGNLALFSDWAWAGARNPRRATDEKLSVGAGVSLLDGVLRLDLAHALRQPRTWRLELHVDAIL
ncbi:MAG TPA: BamA/TamA family outer membrane protein [Longimicrobiales bacterium]|nr:BamA/TamA family outer membrane protein [Longimicrobiales bacterium]